MEIGKALLNDGFDKDGAVISEVANSRKSKVANPGTTVEENAIISYSGENLFQYLKSLGIRKESVLILSSQHHYYYEEGDIRNISAIVNLKPMNFIDDPQSLLKTVHSLLPPGSSFIGFYHSKDKSNASLNSSLFNSSFKPLSTVSESYSKYSIIDMIYNFIDFRINKNFSDKALMRLFKMNGFNIIDMIKTSRNVYFVANHVTVYNA